MEDVTDAVARDVTGKRGIGWIEYWCDIARADARRGVKRGAEQMPKGKRVYYVNAWRRESRRMREVGQLPQLELVLFATSSDAESPSLDGGD